MLSSRQVLGRTRAATMTTTTIQMMASDGKAKRRRPASEWPLYHNRCFFARSVLLSYAELLQVGDLAAGCKRQRQIAVCIFPNGKQVGISSLGFANLPHFCARTRDLQSNNRIEGIDHEQAAMNDNFIPFRDRLSRPAGSEQCLGPGVKRIERSEEIVEGFGRNAEFVGRRRPQAVDCIGRKAAS